jgi:hypothetical protein
VTAQTPQSTQQSAQPPSQNPGIGQTLQASQTARFKPGQRVTVSRRYPPGHLRTPHYCRGKTGTVERVLPAFLNPEEEGYGLYDRPPVTLYRVRFRQTDLWPGYVGPAHDSVDIEIYEHWLEPLKSSEASPQTSPEATP